MKRSRRGRIGSVARTLARLASGGGLPLMTACAPHGAAFAADHPERLSGRWEMEFRLDDGVSPRIDPATAGVVRGELTLLTNRRPAHIAGLQGTPSQYGAFTVDFSAFGFGVQPADHVPGAAARLAGDSVEIALDPRDGSGTYLSGTLRGDSISGQWRYEGDRWSGAAGRFVLRRE
jgi:hypothetical protein